MISRRFILRLIFIASMFNTKSKEEKKLRGKCFKKVIAILFIGIMVMSVCFEPMTGMVQAKTDVTLEEYEDIASSYNVDPSILSYEEYLASNDTNRPDDEYVIDAADYVRIEDMDATPYEDYEGMEGTSVYTDEQGLIEYEVNIQTAGLYEMSLQYYPVEGKNTSIQRSIFVDGELPYQELALVEFSRVWVNESNTWETDNQGNDLKPTQVEAPQWMSEYLYSTDGYITDKLAVYLSQGVHTITVYSINEPMMLRSITLNNSDEVLSYDETKAKWDAAGVTDTSGVLVTMEGEDANRKSSQMLYPQQDTSSPSVSPYSVKELKNNVIGGNSWRTVGDWIEWDFEVDQSGYYYISLHDRQNLVKGIYVSRKITIDGNDICQELNDYGFTYDSDWRMDTLSDSEDNPYKIYLEAGSHTMRMEVVLGDFSAIVSKVQEAVTNLNEVYREVIKITGTAPDAWRDYQIESSLPELEAQLQVIYDLLDGAINDLRSTAGRGSDKETALQTMKIQLAELIKDQEKFAKQLTSFKTNLRAVGNWISSAIEQPLEIDSIYVYSPDVTVEEKNNHWYNKLSHELKKLYYSFTIDYNQIGNVIDEESDTEAITLWIGTGRDQANVIKNMIDDTFTPDSGISVNVQLVDMNTLLRATLAGSGPDVAIQVSSNTGVTGANVSMVNELPVNYGIRNAVMDLTEFDDFEEVASRFFDATLTQFTFDGACYGLPETISFPVMYYRKDILSELGIELPTTWDEMKVIMSVLNNNQMELGMLPKEEVFAMILYQNNGEYYSEDGSVSMLDSDEAVNAFKEYCEFYSDYKLDVTTSEEERFRTGECPIIISNIGTYNNLQVSAPDLKGLWGIAPVPGAIEEDGTLNNTVACSGLASVIMAQSEHKEASWEFLKWWSSADVQNQFSNEMESLMGAAARVCTANMEAFSKLSWNRADYEALSSQLENVKGLPQVPGGYFTWRNINNAYYSVMNDETDGETASPKEELTDKVLLINQEINYKRKEFGLPLAED